MASPYRRSLTLTGFAGGLLALASTLAAQPPAFQAGFGPRAFDAGHGPVRSSSVALSDLNGDGRMDVVVGGIDGRVHAYSGTGTKLWTFDTGGMPIEGKAAIADIDLDGVKEVVIGAGSTCSTDCGTPPAAHGGLYVINGNNGTLQCQFLTGDFNGDGFRDGVFSSPAVADLDQDDGGRLEIAFGAWDAHVRVIHDNCSIKWDKDVRDTVWSSPAIGDIDKDGTLDVVIGVDSHAEGPPINTEDGGILYAWQGTDGLELLSIQIDEVIMSSPALGDIDGDGWLDIVVGTGRCWANGACAPTQPHFGVGQYINAWDHNGNYLPGWPVVTPDRHAFASPALGNLDGDAALEVVINTIDPVTSQNGRVLVLNGNGTAVPGWANVRRPPPPTAAATSCTSTPPPRR